MDARDEKKPGLMRNSLRRAVSEQKSKTSVNPRAHVPPTPPSTLLHEKHSINAPQPFNLRSAMDTKKTERMAEKIQHAYQAIQNRRPWQRMSLEVKKLMDFRLRFAVDEMKADRPTSVTLHPKVGVLKQQVSPVTITTRLSEEDLSQTEASALVSNEPVKAAHVATSDLLKAESLAQSSSNAGLSTAAVQELPEHAEQEALRYWKDNFIQTLGDAIKAFFYYKKPLDINKYFNDQSKGPCAQIKTNHPLWDQELRRYYEVIHKIQRDHLNPSQFVAWLNSDGHDYKAQMGKHLLFGVLDVQPRRPLHGLKRADEVADKIETTSSSITPVETSGRTLTRQVGAGAGAGVGTGIGAGVGTGVGTLRDPRVDSFVPTNPTVSKPGFRGAVGFSLSSDEDSDIDELTQWKRDVIVTMVDTIRNLLFGKDKINGPRWLTEDKKNLEELQNVDPESFAAITQYRNLRPMISTNAYTVEQFIDQLNASENQALKKLVDQHFLLSRHQALMDLTAFKPFDKDLHLEGDTLRFDSKIPVDDQHMQMLSDVIARDHTIKTLVFDNCKLGSRGLTALMDAIANNDTLTHVDVKGCRLLDGNTAFYVSEVQRLESIKPTLAVDSNQVFEDISLESEIKPQSEREVLATKLEQYIESKGQRGFWLDWFGFGYNRQANVALAQKLLQDVRNKDISLQAIFPDRQTVKNQRYQLLDSWYWLFDHGINSQALNQIIQDGIRLATKETEQKASEFVALNDELPQTGWYSEDPAPSADDSWLVFYEDDIEPPPEHIINPEQVGRHANYDGDGITAVGGGMRTPKLAQGIDSGKDVNAPRFFAQQPSSAERSNDARLVASMGQSNANKSAHCREIIILSGTSARLELMSNGRVDCYLGQDDLNPEILQCVAKEHEKRFFKSNKELDRHEKEIKIKHRNPSYAHALLEAIRSSLPNFDFNRIQWIRLNPRPAVMRPNVEHPEVSSAVVPVSVPASEPKPALETHDGSGEYIKRPGRKPF